MFITKKHLSRRTFLRGAGVAVGLPFLDAMVPAWTVLAQTAAAPKPRMGFMYLPHGAIMAHLTPAAEAARGLQISPHRRDNGAWDAGRRGDELRAVADSPAVHAVQETADDRQ